MTVESINNLISYLEAKGVQLTIFAEEDGYTKNFTFADGERGNYPAGQTARYHFVSMIVEGNFAHGEKTPLTNAQIKQAHPELTDQKINNMRSLYEQNKNIRPFEFPIQIKGGSQQSIDLVTKQKQSVYSYLLQNKPLVNYETSKYTRPGLSRKFPVSSSTPVNTNVSPNQPTSATSGDIWINTGTGRNYVFIAEGSKGYWVEL